MTERALVVTGAGRGLGAGISAAAAERGYVVGVVDRDERAALAVASSIGESAIGVGADVTSTDEVDAAFERVAQWSGIRAPDVVANAGIVRFGPLVELDEEAWRSVVDVNLTGTFLTARNAARRMIATGDGGSIVAITSMNGVAPGPNAGAYGAAKAAVARLVEQMALEWGPHGIRVNAVAPGLVDAGMSEAIYADPDVRARRQARVPLGRLGTVDDVCTAVLYMLSDDADYVTGTELLVDGGVTRSIISTLPRPRSVDSVGSDEVR